MNSISECMVDEHDGIWYLIVTLDDGTEITYEIVETEYTIKLKELSMKL